MLALVLSAGLICGLSAHGGQSDGTVMKAPPTPICCDAGDKPTTLKAHFGHFISAVFRPGTLIIPAMTSGGDQVLASHNGYAGNWAGYGRHYRDSVIGNVSGKLAGKFVLPALFHQDESYSPLGPDVDFAGRSHHVLEHLIWTRSDDHGGRRFAVSAIPAAIIMAAAANAYLPQAQRTASSTGVRALENLGAYFLYDVFSEFRTMGSSNRPLARLCRKSRICN
jgi:hypothetical protein